MMKINRICSVILLFIGCMFALSCGQKLSEQELNDLESRAEKGDKDAAIELFAYLDSLEVNEVGSNYGGLDPDTFYNKRIKAAKLAAESGDFNATVRMGMHYHDLFINTKKNIKENKKNYRKMMEVAIKKAHNEGEKNDSLETHRNSFYRYIIKEYKSNFQNQSEEWWGSDSIKTKEELSGK